MMNVVFGVFGVFVVRDTVAGPHGGPHFPGLVLYETRFQGFAGAFKELFVLSLPAARCYCMMDNW